MPPICTRTREMCVLFVPEGERCASYLYRARGGGGVSCVHVLPAGLSAGGAGARGGAGGGRGARGATGRGRGRMSTWAAVASPVVVWCSSAILAAAGGVVGAQLQRPRKQLPCRAPRRGPVVALRGSAGAGAGHGCEPPPPPPPPHYSSPSPYHSPYCTLPPPPLLAHYSAWMRTRCEPTKKHDIGVAARGHLRARAPCGRCGGASRG